MRYKLSHDSIDVELTEFGDAAIVFSGLLKLGLLEVIDEDEKKDPLPDPVKEPPTTN